MNANRSTRQSEGKGTMSAKLLWAGIAAVMTIALMIVALPVCHAATTADGWRLAVGPRAWQFPRDHGAHPDYRTEWWYFTGNLADAAGGRYGYQLTFFRQGLGRAAADPGNPWSLRDVYLAHFALADIRKGSFWFAEQLSRSGPELAGARTGGLDVWCLQWSARMAGRTITLAARKDGRELSLELTPRKPPALHGLNGLSRKGEGTGQSSYYYSFTDLETRGTIRTGQTGAAVPVSGTSWFDQEFGSNQLAGDQIGWDWFGVHLSDGRDLMLYFLRKRDGSREAASSGTLVETTGRTRHLALAEIGVEVLSHWKSEKSGGRYPSRWRIRIPSAGIDLTLATSIPAQELDTGGSTGVVYYEGAVGGQGLSAGRPVTVEGYVEMTGYAGSLGGLF